MKLCAMKLYVMCLAVAVSCLTGCQSESGVPTGEAGVADLMGAEASSVPSSSGARALKDAIRSSPGYRTVAKTPVPLDDTVAPDSTSDDSFPIKFLSWNVESEGASSDVIVAQLQSLNSDDRYDVVALTEVMPKDLAKFRMALGEHYRYAYTKSGFNDRIQLLFNSNRFEKTRDFELKEINVENRYRAPLVVHLKQRGGDQVVTHPELMVMVNHLARGKPEIRQRQAELLVEWARDQTLPIIAIGDYNFDFVFESQKGNPAFGKMLHDNVWHWIKPTQWVDTNWFDNPRSPDGKDDYPGSMLDFAFVAGPAKDFTIECNVIVRDGDFPDDETTSDHRPFELLIAK